MGIERHVVGGFTADPQPPKERGVKNPEKFKEDLAFLDTYDLKETIIQKFEEIHGEDEKMPLDLQERLAKHLLEEFRDTKGDKALVREVMVEEIEKYLKMLTLN